jgi:hypothetical protein
MLDIPLWYWILAAVLLLAMAVGGWFEMRRVDRIAIRKRKIREALATFRISRRYTLESGHEEVFLYSAENSKRLLELDNQILKYGYGSAQWLYFLPERRLFFILELVAIEPEGNLHFIETLHPIKPDRAKKVLSRHPELYQQIFREEI